VVGRTVEEQARPDPAAIQRLTQAAPSILARAMAERAGAGDQDTSFRFGIRIMIAGLEATLAARPGASPR
jgi:Tetracyclin repressor-like, C-terminal domain